MKLIDKSALVAEIEKRMLRYEQERKTEPAYYDGLYTALEDLRDDFINTLEVKEVDLDKEIDLVEDKYHGFESLSRADIIGVAKYFFELGLKVAQKEEPVSEDLEEAVNAYIGYAPEVDESSSVYGKRQAFKAGSEWQKKQIMKDAIDCFVGPREGWFYIGPLIPQHYYNLEKDEEIKMVIIKE